MTEGIIQQVLNKFRNKPTWLIDDLEQELIEKIKKENNRLNQYAGCQDMIPIKKLIGDNK